jgi:hypothetical protein
MPRSTSIESPFPAHQEDPVIKITMTVIALSMLYVADSLASAPQFKSPPAGEAAHASPQPATPAEPAMALVAKSVPPAQPLLPFGDTQDWIVTAALVYQIGSTTDTLTVPAGFVTDLASTPQMLWSAGLTPTGQYSRAAIIHDYLYWSQQCSRDQADNLLLIAMKESNVGWFEENLIHAAVHAAGKSAWNNNAKERKAGLIRILPEAYRKPADANEIWSVYRSSLFKQGVVEAPDPPNSSYCHDGDSTNVPVVSKEPNKTQH